MADPPYEVEFYKDDSGKEPALEWMRGLSETKKRAIGVALHEILAYEGVGVCDSEYGKPLGDGLYEFRLRHTADEILAKKKRGFVKRLIDRPEKVVLRVFFHPHGDKMILLLGGFDKGRFPKRQDTEIKAARKRLSEWKRQAS
jgi:phage-related protein